MDFNSQWKSEEEKIFKAGFNFSQADTDLCLARGTVPHRRPLTYLWSRKFCRFLLSPVYALPPRGVVQLNWGWVGARHKSCGESERGKAAVIRDAGTAPHSDAPTADCLCCPSRLPTYQLGEQANSPKAAQFTQVWGQIHHCTGKISFISFIIGEVSPGGWSHCLSLNRRRTPLAARSWFKRSLWYSQLELPPSLLQHLILLSSVNITCIRKEVQRLDPIEKSQLWFESV